MRFTVSEARSLTVVGALPDVERARVAKNVQLLEGGKALPRDEAEWMQEQIARFRSSFEPTSGARPTHELANADVQTAYPQRTATLGYGEAEARFSGERLAEVKRHAENPELQARYAAPSDVGGAQAAVVKALKSSGAYDRFIQSDVLDDSQKERVLRVAAFAHHFCSEALHSAEASNNEPAAAFAKSNRLHLMDELSLMTEVAEQLGLSPREAENAYIASLFSDVDKRPGGLSLISHHEAGARAASVRLADEFPEDPGRVAEIVELVKAHQLSPPRFMSLMVGIEIKRALGPLNAQQETDLATLQQKLSDPMNRKHQNSTATALAFTASERSLLGVVGMDEWVVPSSQAAWAVVLADSKSNYGKPPHKIYGNRGPETFFQDHTSEEALASVFGPEGTATDAGSVLPTELRASYRTSVEEALRGVERARSKMDAWLKQRGLDPSETPYWRETKLVYPHEGGTEADLNLAKEVRDQFERLLREEAAP